MSSLQSGSSDDFDTWEVVSRVSSNEREDDFDSDSDIEVVSIDTDPECELPKPSSPSLAAGSVNPVFILRVPSTEAAIDDLTGESDESADDEEGTMIAKNLHFACHRQDEETSSVGEEKSDTTQGSDEESTTQESEEIDTTQESEATDIEPVSSVDLSSSNVSVTSILQSSDTDNTRDTCTSPSLDDDGSHLLHTARSIKAPSSMESFREEPKSVDTTLTNEESSYKTEEETSIRTDEDKSSRTESMMATEPFLPLPSLPPLPVESDITAAVTGVVESSKPSSEAEEDKKEGESVPDNAEVEKGHIVEDDDEETCDAVLEEEEDSAVEPQEGFITGFITEIVQPQIEDLDPSSSLNDEDKGADTIDTAEISAETTLIPRVKAETTGSEIIVKTLGNVKYIALVIVMAALCGYIYGSGAFWNTPSIETGLAEANREIANIQEQLLARDTKIQSLQRSVEWMTENASHDLEKLKSSNTELVFDPTFTEGYEYRYYLFTFGKYDEKHKELLRRDEMTIEQIQRLNSIEWMDKVNRLEQEKADLIQQIGMMRYGSPPSVSQVTTGNQVPDQEDEGEQDFDWFTPGDQHLEGQVHVEDSQHKSEGHGHTEDNPVGSGRTEDALKLEDKIVALESDLLFEKASSKKWQSMYQQQKESSDRNKCSGKEMLKEFSQLLQNFSVPEDFSENVKDKWEVVKNQTLEGWQLIMDIASMVTMGTTHHDDVPKTTEQDDVPKTTEQDDVPKTTEQDDIHQTEQQDNSNSKPVKNDWGFDTGFDEEYVESDDENDSSSERNKRGSLPKWSETIQDVYNKTKSSMSDVSQQIKDTWEQVKNLSKDLWKEHEPSVTKLKEKMSKKVEKVSEKLSSWVTRRWNYKRHTWKTQGKSNEERSSQTGSTKRRSYTKEQEEERDKYWTSNNNEEKEEQEEEDDEGNWDYSESVVKRYRRLFWKFRTKMDKLSLEKVMRMNLNHVRKGFNKIEKFVKKIDVQVLSPFNRKWLTCQQEWWLSRYNGVDMGSDCRDVLPCWQVSLATGRDPGSCKGSRGDDPHIRNRPQKEDRHRKDSNNNNRGQKRHGDKIRKPVHGSRHPTGKPNYQQEKNRRGTFEEEEYNDTNSKPHPSDESVPFCDPTSGDCPTTEPSWYIQQLKHREELRLVGDEAESDSSSDWMFTRAEDRDFQRTLPDDWYLRRLDSNENRKNEYLEDGEEYFDYE
ncbi:uncharacterized protein LOC110445581 isoform X2 [Mizuhopecten yessoensis]|uniref:Uncharacterized protein n=1 Tax=Mizuhopecten yessoensis TaxID=6573 RepID=A0A210QYZ9_MIZYE|nr:uncharacterized protein LOC110445581 isoform X2 [Mizuhopecten yessoensis]OWF53966.1 hypothetical protein KP79_PYT15351 [Mizuhopecten yessoensis]